MNNEREKAAADPVPLHKAECVPLPLATCERVPLHQAEKNGIPLDNVVFDSGAAPPREAEGESAAAPLLFRGAPICWAVSQQTRRVVEKNAVGPDTISERPGRKVNLIAYNGQTYQKERFYQAVF